MADDAIIPFSRLKADGDGVAKLEPGETSLEQDTLTTLLAHVMRQNAEIATHAVSVELISFAAHFAERLTKGESIVFRTSVDRLTRTLLFMHGDATSRSGTLLTVNAVYRR